ncbi:MAG: heme-binding domain-containing protein [Bacteroidetes bacterium]|nr:heme-binding domain-containing protein [Bacteroidota bacterium]
MKFKNTSRFVSPLSVLLFIGFTAFISYPESQSSAPNPGENLTIPDDVNAILEKSCFGCHNVDAQSDKAKKKLLLDELPNLSKAKIVAKLDDIHSVVEENEMPPEKFLNKYPDKALTKEEASRLKEWAKTTAEEMMGN